MLSFGFLAEAPVSRTLPFGSAFLAYTPSRRCAPVLHAPRHSRLAARLTFPFRIRPTSPRVLLRSSSWPIRDCCCSCCCCSAPACRLMPPARPAPAWLPRVYLPITRCRSVNIYHTLPCQRELSHSLSEPGGCVQSCPNLMPQSHLERRTDGTNHLGVASSPSAKAIWAITSAAMASTTLR